jgi:molecular chaperone DnaK
MARIIGIDLGTTNSCVAIMDGGDAKVITNPEGGRTSPSVYAVSNNGERLVGQIAKRQAVTNPSNTVFGVKRLIGRKYDSPEVQKDITVLPYTIEKAANGDAHISLKGKSYSPAEISAQILASLRKAAEEFLGETVTDAVITVPAYFERQPAPGHQGCRQNRRISTYQRIINEPTAASLAYGLEGKTDRKSPFSISAAVPSISRFSKSGTGFSRSRPPTVTPIWAVRISICA